MALDVRIVGVAPNQDRFDAWRFERRGIPSRRLLLGGIGSFGEPSLWSDHKWQILGAVLVCGIQSILVIALWRSTRRRRKTLEALGISERKLTERTAQLQHVKEVEEQLRHSCAEVNLLRDKLEERLRFETLVSDLSARFIKLVPSEVDREIERALEELLDFFEGDRCWLVKAQLDGASCVTHAAYGEGIGCVSRDVDFAAMFPWSFNMLARQRQPLAFARVADLPPEAEVDRQTYTATGIRSGLAVPLFTGEQVAYLLVMQTQRKERAWPEEYVSRLRLPGEILVSALTYKQTGQALRESEARLELAAESAGVGLWALDVATGGFWMTARTRTMFGFPPDEEIDFERFLEVVHPEDREPLRRVVRQTAESLENARAEYRIVLRDGSVRWILSQGRVRRSPSGASDRLMGVSLDTSERKAYEEAILQQKRFTETAINSLPGIFYLYDSEWRMIRWNRNHEFLTGFSAEELKGRMVLDWFSEDFKGTIAAAVRKVFDEGEAMVEAPLTIKGGGQVPYLFKGVRLDVAGEAYFMGMGIDISQRKANENALRKSEQQLRLITDSVPAMIAYVDSSQRYIFVNESYAQFVGKPRDQIPGKQIRDVLREDAYEQIRERVATVLSGQPLTFEITIPSRGSESRHMLVTYVPELREGDIQGFFASIHDVTDFERAKEQAREARETLYHFGRVKMLEALSSSLSHEMQQPLTGVLSNAQAAEMLLEDPPSDLDEIRVILKDIVADAKRAGEVMWQLRAFLRNQDTSLRALDLKCLIEDVLSVMNSDMVIHNTAVVRNLAADLPHVMGDSVQLKQVLINLIMNAQQAMEKSASGVHRLVVHTSTDGVKKVTVGIEDSGPGIEEGELEHIFEPFHTTKKEGTGMGLAISRFIIEAHGGQIWAENQAKGGARISFSLPVAGGSLES